MATLVEKDQQRNNGLLGRLRQFIKRDLVETVVNQPVNSSTAVEENRNLLDNVPLLLRDNVGLTRAHIRMQTALPEMVILKQHFETGQIDINDLAKSINSLAREIQLIRNSTKL